MTNKNYNVKETKKGLKLKPNSFNDSIWNTANTLSDFSQPWNNKKHRETLFRALYDQKNLYIRFDVNESTKFYSNEVSKKLDVANGERVEVFFRKDTELEQYYCLEVDRRGHILDYSASHYRKFDYDWCWQHNHLNVKSKYTTNKYSVCIQISLVSLKKLGLIKNGNTIEMGIYRGRCVKQLDINVKKIEWVTWVDPKTKKPDFHVPSSFGRLTLI